MHTSAGSRVEAAASLADTYIHSQKSIGIALQYTHYTLQPLKCHQRHSLFCLYVHCGTSAKFIAVLSVMFTMKHLRLKGMAWVCSHMLSIWKGMKKIYYNIPWVPVKQPSQSSYRSLPGIISSGDSLADKSRLQIRWVKLAGGVACCTCGPLFKFPICL